MGLSRTERLRIFRDILRPPHARGNTAASDVPVDMGDGVCVDAPFGCEYGYNISIGHDVVIGSNCLIQDPCKVRIGDKCIIGPDVKLLGNSWSSNPAERSGSAGVARGKPITIEENVLIGAGVIIKEGVRIGRNCTIGPGKVVTQVSLVLFTLTSFMMGLRGTVTNYLLHRILAKAPHSTRQHLV